LSLGVQSFSFGLQITRQNSFDNVLVQEGGNPDTMTGQPFSGGMDISALLH